MKITPSQVHWFRLRRSGLVEPFATPEETAQRLLGVQAQLMPAAALSVWNRTKNCNPALLDRARLERKSLVRFWGQRNTIHLYRSTDWPFLHAAFAERRSLMQKRLEKAGLLDEFRRVVTRIRKRLEQGDALSYKDVKAPKLQAKQDHWIVSYVVFMQLVREGVACHGPDNGTESTFVHREHWMPDLEWDPPERDEACAELAAEYLAAYGPAEVRDLAFWYGTSLSSAKRWIALAGDRCREVKVGGASYWCREADLEEIAVKPPPPGRWPVRMLYRFDPMVLAHKDKSWLIDEERYKKVWRAAAHVEAVLLVRGRIAGTWRYDRKGKGLQVRVQPFGELSATVRRAVERQATGVAKFMGRRLDRLEVG